MITISYLQLFAYISVGVLVGSFGMTFIFVYVCDRLGWLK